jgi:glyoxylase-like metal-dependent hydrolase (beta-lactamase superfamily II)/rhodanese-related sulfurtransferase
MSGINVVEITSFVEEGLGNSSYLVSIGDGRGLVVDSPRDIRPFLAHAHDHRLTLSHALETHLHADFVSGSRELAATGASILAPRAARLGYGHVGLDDGLDVDLGGLRLRPIATPGHTPEHLSYLLLDGDRPVALFSGGALLPGGVARTDLIAAEQTEPLARSLYRALHERVLTLPDDLPVYPTHGGGSFCSTSTGGERTTTIGRERATNPLLRAASEDDFVERLLASLGSYPGYFHSLREVNRAGPRVYGGLPNLPALTLDAFERRIEAGAEVIDVRPIEAFAAGHIPGSLSIELRQAFASWLGWLVPLDRPLVFAFGANQDRHDLLRQALGIGYERLEGELEGGVEAWSDAGRPLATTGLTRSLDPDSQPLVDVRQAAEYRAGHIPGAVPIELGDLAGPAIADLPGRAVFMCGHGERAMTAASMAQRSGRAATVFIGGPRDWARQAGRPLARD